MADGIQVTIILDSGLFLTDEGANGYAYSEVGYFIPHIMVYRDGKKEEEFDPAKTGPDCRRINVRKFSGSQEIAETITFSDSLLKHLLRLHNIYGYTVDADYNKLDCCFHFNSGHFCSSKVKERKFKEYDGTTRQLTGQRKSVGLIAHDIAIHYKLAPGESLKFLDEDGTSIWSSDDIYTLHRIEIEVMADNSTAEMFYCDALNLKGQNYWLPNQDDPPPTWIHGGHGGSGNP